MNLNNAMDVGQELFRAGFDDKEVERIAWAITESLYVKPRARRYRNLCAFHIAKGWWAEYSICVETGSYKTFCFENVDRFMDMPHEIRN